MESGFLGRVGCVQRVLASYRIPFFDGLAARCAGGMEVFVGQPRRDESMSVGDGLRVARLVSGRNVHIGRGRLYLCWQRGLLTWLRRFRPDALILPADPRLLTTHMAIRLMRAWGRPVIGIGLGTLEWPGVWGMANTLRSAVLSRFYRSFDVLMAYSSKGAADYVRAGVPPERVKVAYNAVSPSNAEILSARVREHPDLVQRYRHDLGLNGKPVALYVGRLIPRKRVGDLLQACSTLSDACELLIVGDGPERASLENLAATLLPRARFLGHLEGQDLALAYAAADLFVLPGAGGLAVHEAMLYGKPVVVGSSDGTEADLVREGCNGHNVMSGDTVTLERVIRSCLEDPDALRRMGLESRRIATEEVTMDAMIDTYVRAFLLVTEGRVAKRPGG